MGLLLRQLDFEKNERSFQLSAKMNKGNSGGAVINTQGNVVGIATAKLNLVEILQGDGYLPEDINFAIHTDRLKSLGLDFKVMQDNNEKEMRLDELYPTIYRINCNGSRGRKGNVIYISTLIVEIYLEIV